MGSISQFNPDQIDYLKSDKKLSNFMERLNEDFISSRSGVSKRKEKQLQTVKEEYKQSKVVYLQKEIIYKEIKKILMESEHIATFDSDIHGLASIARTLMTAELRSKLIDEKTNVLGLEDKHFNAPKVEEADVHELQWQLELVLQEMTSEFTEYYEKMIVIQEDKKQKKEDSSNDISMFHAIIERKKQQLDDRNEYLTEITAKRQSLSVNYFEKMKESASVLSDIAKLILSYDLDENKLNVLCAKTKTLLLKMRRFKLEVEMQTYPAKTVKAHQKIRDHLKDSLAEATSKKQYAEKQLSIINSIGSEFNSLASEYGVVIDAIKSKELVLRTLKKQNED